MKKKKVQEKNLRRNRTYPDEAQKDKKKEKEKSKVPLLVKKNPYMSKIALSDRKSDSKSDDEIRWIYIDSQLTFRAMKNARARRQLLQAVGRSQSHGSNWV